MRILLILVFALVAVVSASTNFITVEGLVRKAPLRFTTPWLHGLSQLLCANATDLANRIPEDVFYNKTELILPSQTTELCVDILSFTCKDDDASKQLGICIGQHPTRKLRTTIGKLVYSTTDVLLTRPSTIQFQHIDEQNARELLYSMEMDSVLFSSTGPLPWKPDQKIVSTKSTPSISKITPNGTLMRAQAVGLSTTGRTLAWVAASILFVSVVSVFVCIVWQRRGHKKRSRSD